MCGDAGGAGGAKGQRAAARPIQAGDFPHPGFAALPAEISDGEAVRKLPSGKSVAETDDATLDNMLDLNYRSAFFIARAVLPHMRQPAGHGTRRHGGGIWRVEGDASGADPHHRAASREAGLRQWVQPAQAAALLV